MNMAFTIEPRRLPHFASVQYIFSKHVMFLSLVEIQAGCTLLAAREH